MAFNAVSQSENEYAKYEAPRAVCVLYVHSSDRESSAGSHAGDAMRIPATEATPRRTSGPSERRTSASAVATATAVVATQASSSGCPETKSSASVITRPAAAPRLE